MGIENIDSVYSFYNGKHFGGCTELCASCNYLLVYQLASEAYLGRFPGVPETAWLEIESPPWDL